MKAIRPKIVVAALPVLIAAVSLTACSSAEERKANYLKRGQTYYDQKNYDKASVEVRNALQIDPKYVEGRYLFAEISERKGDARAAAGQYLGVIEEHPEYAPARAAMARLYLLGGLVDEATKLVDEGLLKAPDNAELIMMRGAVKARSGKVDEALKDAVDAYQKDPGNDLTISLLASLYKQQGQLDDAVKVVNEGIVKMPDNIDLRVVLADLENSRKHYDVVETQLKKVIDLDPKVLGHRTRLVQFYRFREDGSKAEAVWRQAVKDIPDEVQPKLALVSYLWRAKGEAVATKEMQDLLTSDKDQNLKLEWASFLARQSKTDEAKRVFGEIIESAGIKSAGLGARNRLAALLLMQQQADKAGALVAEVLAENPRDNDALIMRANMAMAKGDTATAITDLRSVMRDQPASAPLMRALARAHLQNNETTLAEESLRNAVQADPADLETRKALAQIYMKAGKMDQARVLFDELSQIPGINDSLDVQESRFRVQMAQKDFKSATVTIQDMQRLHGNESVTYYLAGILAEAQNDRSTARAQYQQALTKQPDGAEPLAALVRLDVADKQIERALGRINLAISTNPKHAVAHSLRGELLVAQGQFAPAQAAFSKAMELMPKWEAPYRGVAITQLAQKQTDAAIATYQRGIGVTRSDVLPVDLAALYERLGKTDDAIKIYREWVKRDPKSQIASNNLAVLLVNYGKDQAAITEAATLADKLAHVAEPAVLDTRGWVKFKAGDYTGALPLLEQAVRAAPGANIVRYHLGMAQWKSGNVSAARDNLQASLKSGAPFFGSDEAQKVLAQLNSAG